MADLLSVILGGGFALAGVYIGPLMQERNRKAARKSAYTDVMRDRTEEMLGIISDLRFFPEPRVRDLMSKNHIEQSSSSYVASYNRLFTLISAYFPQHIEIVGDFRDDMTSYLEGENRSVDETVKGVSQRFLNLATSLEKVMIEEARRHIGA